MVSRIGIEPITRRLRVVPEIANEADFRTIPTIWFAECGETRNIAATPAQPEPFA